MMGGEHSLTYPCVKAYKGKIGFVVMDAHYDLREEYGGIKNNHACISRHIIEDITDKYLSIGIRSGAKEEYEYVKNNKNIMSYSSDDVYSMGIDAILREAGAYMKDCDRVYVSLDMDAIDPAYAPGLGTPEPFGMYAPGREDGDQVLRPEGSGLRRGGDIPRIRPRHGRDTGRASSSGTSSRQNGSQCRQKRILSQIFCNF